MKHWRVRDNNPCLSFTDQHETPAGRKIVKLNNEEIHSYQIDYNQNIWFQVLFQSWTGLEGTWCDSKE